MEALLPWLAVMLGPDIRNRIQLSSLYEAAAIFRKISHLSKKRHTPAGGCSAALTDEKVGRSNKGSGKPETNNDSSSKHESHH